MHQKQNTTTTKITTIQTKPNQQKHKQSMSINQQNKNEEINKERKRALPDNLSTQNSTKPSNSSLAQMKYNSDQRSNRLCATT